jgi:hypothetical protein
VVRGLGSSKAAERDHRNSGRGLKVLGDGCHGILTAAAGRAIRPFVVRKYSQVNHEGNILGARTVLRGSDFHKNNPWSKE